ncbi:hypothetical protein FHX42_001267 [Saccharopolyspora lacisalsi]|uniref:Uncharacterized protein n=1 Tax=Halosaccharopolyspora lacisalsi TaxID=1000566 RepID=A0A839DYV5_9PSEU|nr:hypothetical protein [Halosaccharopolyspora lacisalsi]MBA8823938.1 hypothetical protein [Halosaccharopolyspora lacisalsi]
MDNLKTRRLTSFGAAVGSCLLAVTLAAAPAYASGSVVNAEGSAGVDFESYGEHLIVHDYAFDGRDTVGVLDVKTGNGWDRRHEVPNYNGYYGAAVDKNLSYAEGTSVRYKACELYGGYFANCSGWRYDTA